MPQPITSIQLQNLQDEIKAGGVNAAVQAYTFLEEQGYSYGGWARGVAAGDSISGQSALSYLRGTALMGMGGEACRNLSQQQIDEIPTEMATQTLETYEEIAKNNEKVLTRDPLYALVISPRCPMARWHRMDLRRSRRSMRMAMAFSMTGPRSLPSSSSGAA